MENKAKLEVNKKMWLKSDLCARLKNRMIYATKSVFSLVLCIFFMKSIVRIIVWLFDFLVSNFIYVIIIVLGVCILFKGCCGF